MHAFHEGAARQLDEDRVAHRAVLNQGNVGCLTIPAGSPEDNRAHQIGFRINSALKAELEGLARADRRSLASYLEILLEAHVEEAKKEKSFREASKGKSVNEINGTQLSALQQADRVAFSARGRRPGT